MYIVLDYFRFLLFKDDFYPNSKTMSTFDFISIVCYMIISSILSVHFINIVENNFGHLLIPKYNFTSSVLIAPVLEEMMFRMPLALLANILYYKNLFSNKVNRIIVMVLFFISSIIFGMLHITNHEFSDNIPFIQIVLYTLPQILGGTILGFICLNYRYGLFLAILAHGIYNFIV